MTFETLCDFIKTKMRMSRIYQPLLIKSLIECDGMAICTKNNLLEMSPSELCR